VPVLHEAFPSSLASAPVHPWHGELEQFRVKVRRFSAVPGEFTVQRISFERDLDAYRRAADLGLSSVGRPTGRKTPPEERSAEALERSQRRAKTTVRLQVTELAPTALVTFTTRQVMPLDKLLWCWQHFARSMRLAGQDFEYVAVPERHPTNPDHLHLHVAYRGRTPFSLMRRLWHVALEALNGRRVNCILRGKEAPGNIDVQPAKARDSLRRVRKIARYISKYITKDLIADFGRRRYWPSKGIDLAAAQTFWLSSLNMTDAIREACQVLGQWDDLANVPAQRFFNPSDRVAWCAIDPAATPPPPF
jgi:hypothetical protein